MKKICYFCSRGANPDYKEAEVLENFVYEDGRIKQRRATGTCSEHQRLLTKQIANARKMALLKMPHKN